MQLHISEKSGRGVPKIIETYGKRSIEFRKNSIVMKIPFRWINVVGNKVGNKVKDKKHLTFNREAILEVIKNNPYITASELSNNICISETAIDKNIKYLKDFGYIKRVGSKKSGY